MFIHHVRFNTVTPLLRIPIQTQDGQAQMFKTKVLNLFDGRKSCRNEWKKENDVGLFVNF